MAGHGLGLPSNRRNAVLLVLGVAAVSAVLVTVPGPLSDVTRRSGQPSDHHQGPGPAAPGSVGRITAADVPVVDVRGVAWDPGSGLVGGHTVHAGGPIEATASPVLYATIRDGVESYHRDVPGPGTYAVDLYFVEPTASRAGQRVFDVTINGNVVASDVDIFSRVGARHPFHVLASVATHTGAIDVSFTATAGHTMVSAIEVAYLGPATSEKLLWSDEFDGPTGAPVDDSKWQHETGGGGWGNKELERYTDNPANAHLDGDGNLAIVARRSQAPDGSPVYTSARLITKDRATFTHGRVVLRAQVPAGKGLWPAFWAVGDDIEQVGFPGSGELDIMESDGEPGSLSGKLHGPDEARGTYSLGTGIGDAPTGRFADFTMVWTPIGVAFQVDGSFYSGGVPADLPATSAWVFDKPFYLILNMAVGGNFPGNPDDSTVFPAQFLIDHIRVFGQ